MPNSASRYALLSVYIGETEPQILYQWAGKCSKQSFMTFTEIVEFRLEQTPKIYIIDQSKAHKSPSISIDSKVLCPGD